MIDLADEARLLVETALGVQAGERVAIVVDDSAAGPLVDACRAAVRGVGARETVIGYEPDYRRPLRTYCLFASASLRSVILPAAVGDVLRQADAALLLTSDMDSMFAADLASMIAGGLRAIFLPYLSVEGAQRMLPKSAPEVLQLRDESAHFGRLFAGAREARLTSRGGTDLTMRLGQWRVRTHLGMVDGPGLQVLPAGQVTHVPDDGTATGTVVIDRSIADHDYRALDEPITLTVRDGNVVRIDGGPQARRTADFLASLADPRVYHLTELGLGLNARCQLTGVGAPTEDTHTRGAVSLAMGCDVHIGGGLPGPTHIDMTMWFPTLELDGAVVVDAGRVVGTASDG